MYKPLNCTENKLSIINGEIDLAYADDGYHLQYHHTPQSIWEETTLAGLKLKAVPQKYIIHGSYVESLDMDTILKPKKKFGIGLLWQKKTRNNFLLNSRS